MPKGYVILTETIHDEAGMAAYGKASTAPVIEFGGEPLVVDEHQSMSAIECNIQRPVAAAAAPSKQAPAPAQAPAK